MTIDVRQADLKNLVYINRSSSYSKPKNIFLNNFMVPNTDGSKNTSSANAAYTVGPGLEIRKFSWTRQSCYFFYISRFFKLASKFLFKLDLF